MDRMKTAARVSRAEFGRWLRGSRIIIFAVMLVFVHMQIITTLNAAAEMMGEPVSVPEAFVALGNSGVIVLVVPLLFLALMADYPQKGGMDYMIHLRCSKLNWVCGQLMFALEAVGFTEAFLVISSTLMMSKNGIWSMEFSDTVTHYASAFPERSGDYILQLLPENLYQQMTLKSAFWETLTMMVFYLLILALVLLLSALCNKKYAGILADGALIIAGAATCSAESKFMWIFPMAHSIPWVHYEKYLRAEVFPVNGSYIYMICGCVGLAAACILMSRRYQTGR